MPFVKVKIFPVALLRDYTCYIASILRVIYRLQPTAIFHFDADSGPGAGLLIDGTWLCLSRR